MKVSDLMTAKPITADPDTPVLEARQIMLGKRIRHLLVTDGPKLLGIVTDRDIRLNLPSPATSLSVWEINYLLARLTVASVMTKALVTVSPGEGSTGRRRAHARPPDRRPAGRRRRPARRDHHGDLICCARS